MLFEQMSGAYMQVGNYLLPNLTLPRRKNEFIGVWGQRHVRHLKTHRKILYINQLTSGKLNTYLADIDKQAEELFFQMVDQMVEPQGITEQLKAADQMKWIGKMNAIRNAAMEIINAEVIYS